MPTEISRTIRKILSFLRIKLTKNVFFKLWLVADPVIEAIARLEFEDGMRTRVFLGGCWGP